MTAINSDRKSARKSIILGMLGLSLLGLGYMYTEYLETGEIKKDFSVTTGIITTLGDIGMRGLEEPTIFEYKVEGKNYSGEFKKLIPCNYDGFTSKELMKYPYTIVYNNQNPGKSSLLISRQMFEAYGLTFKEADGTIYSRFWSCE